MLWLAAVVFVGVGVLLALVASGVVDELPAEAWAAVMLVVSRVSEMAGRRSASPPPPKASSSTTSPPGGALLAFIVAGGLAASAPLSGCTAAAREHARDRALEVGLCAAERCQRAVMECVSELPRRPPEPDEAPDEETASSESPHQTDPTE